MTLWKIGGFDLAVYAAGDPDAPKIALVLPGRLETKDYAHIQSHVRHLAELGFYAVSFDPPGTWESPGDITIYTTENYLAAVNDLIKHLGNRPTLLVGHSRGGSIAMLVAVENPSVVGFVAMMASAAPARPDEEWKAAGKLTFYRDLPPGDRPSAEQVKFDLPYYCYENHLLADLAKCKKPKLFIAGKYDHANQTRDVVEAYETSCAPKQFRELPTGHSYRYHPDITEAVNAKLTKFVQVTGLLQ